MDKFTQFEAKLLKLLKKDTCDLYAYSNNIEGSCAYNECLAIDRCWQSYLRLKEVKDRDITYLIKQTFKKLNDILTGPLLFHDKATSIRLIETLRRVGFKYCNIKFKQTRWNKYRRDKLCKRVCKVKQDGSNTTEKCELHSRKERRKVKIHKFLKDQFDPIGLRDMVDITTEYVNNP